jgi:1,4-dihydroxy-2-naphthoate octaprenyltransferase
MWIKTAGNIMKLARWEFIPASIVPFMIGVFYAVSAGNALRGDMFWAALIGVASAHIGGNVLNNYYDHRSGADVIHPAPTSFYGGSTLIREKVFIPRKALLVGCVFLVVSVICGSYLYLVSKDPFFLLAMAAGGALTIEYTAPPLRLSYRRWGEAVIFLLFGTGLVVGGYYLVAGRVTAPAVLLSFPPAFLILSVILCNEVPDAPSDSRAGKMNLVSAAGPEKGHILYLASVVLAAVTLVLDVMLGVLPYTALGILPVFILGGMAWELLRTAYNDPGSGFRASAMTVTLNTVSGMALLLVMVTKR